MAQGKVYQTLVDYYSAACPGLDPAAYRVVSLALLSMNNILLVSADPTSELAELLAATAYDAIDDVTSGTARVYHSFPPPTANGPVESNTRGMIIHDLDRIKDDETYEVWDDEGLIRAGSLELILNVVSIVNRTLDPRNFIHDAHASMVMNAGVVVRRLSGSADRKDIAESLTERVTLDELITAHGALDQITIDIEACTNGLNKLSRIMGVGLYGFIRQWVSLAKAIAYSEGEGHVSPAHQREAFEIRALSFVALAELHKSEQPIEHLEHRTEQLVGLLTDEAGDINSFTAGATTAGIVQIPTMLDIGEHVSFAFAQHGEELIVAWNGALGGALQVVLVPIQGAIRPTHFLEGHAIHGGRMAMAYVADRWLLATTAMAIRGEADAVRLWELVGDHWHQLATVHVAFATALALGQWRGQEALIVGTDSANPTVRIFAVATGELLASKERPESDFVHAVAITSLEGKDIAVSSSADGLVRTFAAGMSESELGHEHLGFHGHGKLLATLTAGGRTFVATTGTSESVFSWDLGSCRPSGLPLHEQGENILAIAFASRGAADPFLTIATDRGLVSRKKPSDRGTVSRRVLKGAQTGRPVGAALATGTFERVIFAFADRIEIHPLGLDGYLVWQRSTDQR